MSLIKIRIRPLFILVILFVLLVVFSRCSKKSEPFVSINDSIAIPEISFTYSGANTYAPDAVSFSNTTTNAYAYKWSFGDGYTSAEGNPVHIYTSGGTYTVKLIATGEAGTDSSAQSVTVLNAPTTLKITGITLTDFSFVNSSGANWDIPGAPDVYFKITDMDSTVFYDGIALIDSNVVQSDLPVVWNLASPFIISDFSEYKSIKIYDADSFPDPDDYIGKAGFTPATYTTVYDHYPSSIDINNADVFITLKLKWE